MSLEDRGILLKETNEKTTNRKRRLFSFLGLLAKTELSIMSSYF